MRVGIDSATKIIKSNTEYILFLARSNKKAENGKFMYSCVSMGMSINEITEAHKKETEYKDHLGGSQFSKEVYTKYYYEVDKLDRRIDVEKETEKLCAKYGVKELGDFQKDLINKLCKQYGSK